MSIIKKIINGIFFNYVNINALYFYWNNLVTFHFVMQKFQKKSTFRFIIIIVYPDALKEIKK